MRWLLLFLVFGGSFARPAIGVSVVLFNLSTLVFSWCYIPLAGGVGFKLADAALLGLFAGLLWTWRERLKNWERPFFAILAWFALSALWRVIAGSSDPNRTGFSLAYNLVIRAGLRFHSRGGFSALPVYLP
jgi:hypothetical protein